MKPKGYRSPLASMQATKPDPEKVKRNGWRDDGILVINIEDERLGWLDKSYLDELGNRLYGKRKEAENDKNRN